MQKPNQRLVKTLLENKLSLALAESVTCGLAAHQLNSVKGTSEVLKGSIVCYDEEVKIKLLKIPRRLINDFTAESAQVTDALAENLGRLISADVYAAVTGLAAPGGSESKTKPVGTIFFSVLFKNKMHRLKKRFRGKPLEIKKKTCDELYSLIISAISITT
jgi:PncC family amidohydrolase